jgi:hypothetical protein
MELDPGIHIASTWFVLETGCDRKGAGGEQMIGNVHYCESNFVIQIPLASRSNPELTLRVTKYGGCSARKMNSAQLIE